MIKMSKQLQIRNSTAEFLIYKSSNWQIKIDVLLQDENIWLPQKKIAELFWVNIPAISKHIKNIFSQWELKESSVISILETTAEDGKKYDTTFYNLDMIIAVWYRVNSSQATNFRIWANSILKEYIIKWFTMDDERLKEPYYHFGKDYFDEQLQRIKDIRSSERRFYQKITDIYSKCSIDYDSKSETTKTFFATVQNKLHFSITWKTAAEIITSRANSKKENMWLTSWKFSPNWPIRKNDVSIAKNYLNEKELDSLNRIVSMYLDYGEDKAKRQIPMTMQDWETKLNAFLKFNEREILSWSWEVTTEIAKAFGENEFEKYRVIQDRLYKSDFDKLLEEQEKLLKWIISEI